MRHRLVVPDEGPVELPVAPFPVAVEEIDPNVRWSFDTHANVFDHALERVELIGRPARLERFRPWYVRWFTRPWRPFAKWETVRDGHVEAVASAEGLSYDLTIGGRE